MLPHRRQLRSHSTTAEKILWDRLRNRQLLGTKFKRQYSFGPYIADFYCHTARLVVELDGSQHQGSEVKKYDQSRTNYLEDLEITVIRFSNQEVTQNLSQVLEEIKQHLISPLPNGGEGLGVRGLTSKSESLSGGESDNEGVGQHV